MSTAPINLEERRRRRSTCPLTAMGYQLEQVIEDFDLDSCVVASPEGLLVAKSALQSFEDAEYYAAYASDILAPILAEEQAATMTLAGDVHLHAETVMMYDMPMLVIAIGKDASMTHLSTFRAVAGIERILQEDRVAKLAA